MRRGGGTEQRARGAYIAQALGDGARAYVNVYPPPPPPGPEALAEAEARLAELRLETVPPPRPLPPGSLIRYSVNQEFVGREAELKALAAHLREGGTAAMTGLGGVGKTQLASAFLHRYGHYFAGGVFWVSLADPEGVRAEVAACGGPDAVSLWPEGSGLGLPDQVSLVQGAWQGPLPRLVLFDNCEDPALLERWRPPTGGARVLITARRTEWPVHLGVRTISLGVLGRGEAIELLRRHRPDLGADDPSLDQIAHVLGDLPLALHLAGSYLARYRGGRIGRPADYLRALRGTGRLAQAGGHRPAIPTSYLARLVQPADPGEMRMGEAPLGHHAAPGRPASPFAPAPGLQRGRPGAPSARRAPGTDGHVATLLCQPRTDWPTSRPSGGRCPAKAGLTACADQARRPLTTASNRQVRRGRTTGAL